MLSWTPPPSLSKTAHSAPSLSPFAAGIRYVAERIPLAGLASHLEGAVHLMAPEPPLCPPEPPDIIPGEAGAGADEPPVPVGGWSGGSSFGFTARLAPPSVWF